MSAFERDSTAGAALMRRDGDGSPYLHAGLAPASPHEGIDVKGIIKLLRRRLALILAVVLVVTGGTAVIAFNLTPQYRAVAAVLIEPRSRLVIDPELASGDRPQEAERIRTQIALLQSRSYAENVILALGLLKDPHFNISLRQEPNDAGALLPLLTEWLRGNGWTPDTVRAEPVSGDGHLEATHEVQAPSDHESTDGSMPRALDGPRAWLVELGARLLGDAAGSESPTAAPGKLSYDGTLALATSRLLDGLDVQQYGDTGVIRIHYTSEDAETAARIANELADVYVRDQLTAKQAANNRALEWLSERLSALHDLLLQSEAAVETYKAEHGLHNAQGLRLSEQHVATLSEALVTAHAERSEKETRLRLIKEMLARGEGLESLPEVMNSPIITNLRQEQAALLREEAQLSQEYGPRHPRILQVKADAQNLAAKIQSEVRNIVRSVERQVVAARAREETVAAELRSVRTEAEAQNQADVQLRMLEREAEANRTIYTTLLSRFKELSEQQSLLEAGVRIISNATVPNSPSFPRPKLMTAAGFTASLMLGVALAFIRDRLDSGLRSIRQVEQVLGLAPVGVVPRVRAGKCRDGLASYLLKRPQSAYAEAIRAIQTTLYLSNIGDPPKTILVTSSMPGEGKTTLALSLAVLAAFSGRRTIVVDLDLRRPRVAEALGSRVTNAGLTEHLAGKADLDEAIHTGPDRLGLDFLPVRRLATNPTDVLASRRIETLIDELRHRYDLIVLDSAPILGISDTKVAARLADAVLLAVQWGKTTDEVALNGLEALFESHAKVAGAVLTQVNLRRHSKYGFGDVAQYYGKFQKYYID